MSNATEHDGDIHPLFAALERAPVGKPYAPEVRAELDQAVADIVAGRVKLVPHDEVHAWLDRQVREEEFAAEYSGDSLAPGGTRNILSTSDAIG